MRAPGGSRPICPVISSLLVLGTLACAGCSGGGTSPSPPTTANPPPVVTSIVVQGTLGPREPAQYASLGETVNVVATVTDAETPPAGLIYEWSSNVGGTFAGQTASTTWTAPTTASTPLPAALTLTVTERFGTNQTNRVQATSVVDLHNSPKEVGDLARLFLEDFSNQLAPDTVMRNFTDKCPTTADERHDVIRQQAELDVIEHDIGAPVTTVSFSGVCSFIGRHRLGDACSLVPVRWVSRIKRTGEITTSSGIDQVTAIFDAGRWRLCASDYDERSSKGVSLLKYWIQR